MASLEFSFSIGAPSNSDTSTQATAAPVPATTLAPVPPAPIAPVSTYTPPMGSYQTDILPALNTSVSTTINTPSAYNTVPSLMTFNDIINSLMRGTTYGDAYASGAFNNITPQGIIQSWLSNNSPLSSLDEFGKPVNLQSNALGYHYQTDKDNNVTRQWTNPELDQHQADMFWKSTDLNPENYWTTLDDGVTKVFNTTALVEDLSKKAYSQKILDNMIKAMPNAQKDLKEYTTEFLQNAVRTYDTKRNTLSDFNTFVSASDVFLEGLDTQTDAQRAAISEKLDNQIFKINNVDVTRGDISAAANLYQLGDAVSDVDEANLTPGAKSLYDTLKTGDKTALDNLRNQLKQATNAFKARAETLVKKANRESDARNKIVESDNVFAANTIYFEEADKQGSLSHTILNNKTPAKNMTGKAVQARDLELQLKAKRDGYLQPGQPQSGTGPRPVGFNDSNSITYGDKWASYNEFSKKLSESDPDAVAWAEQGDNYTIFSNRYAAYTNTLTQLKVDMVTNNTNWTNSGGTVGWLGEWNPLHPDNKFNWDKILTGISGFAILFGMKEYEIYRNERLAKKKMLWDRENAKFMNDLHQSNMRLNADLRPSSSSSSSSSDSKWTPSAQTYSATPKIRTS